MTNLKDLHIGYIPYSGDHQAPADRRRFCWYASTRDISFEIANPSEEYDLVILNARSDLSILSKYQGKAKIIFELIDSYLDVPKTNIKGLFRGLAKFASRQHQHLCLNHWKALQDMCLRANAVICSTEEQKQKIKLDLYKVLIPQLFLLLKLDNLMILYVVLLILYCMKD